jgi:glycosyltransferase involved in cell wall biosynthesis
MHVIGGGEFGGAERHILNLAGALDPQKIYITVCCLFKAPFAQITRKQGIPTITVPMKNKLDFSVVLKISSLIKEKQIDIVHTHGVRANLLGRLAARLAARPAVTTVHSRLSLDYPGFFSRLVNSWAERASRGLSSYFIAVSRELEDILKREGISEDKVEVIHNGIDFSLFKPKCPPGSYRESLGYGDDVPLVAIIGRMHPVKGHRFFLLAAKEVLADMPEARFLVAGYGPEQPALESLAQQLEITDKVNFAGFIEDIPSLLADIDLVVIPSLSEGLPLTAIEALAVGVPVVATSVGGLLEVLKDCHSGLLVSPGDYKALARGILWMINHPEEAREMAQRGRKAVLERFSSLTMARKTEKVYQKVFERAGKKN